MRSFAEVVFWAAVALLVYAYAGYPLFLAAVAMFFPPRRAPEISDDELPTVTLLITARNEAAGIGAKLEQSLALDYPADKLEILVASDASTDATDEIVAGIAGREKRVRLVRVRERRGKTHAQNVAVQQARGEIVVFSDATAVYDREAIRALAREFREERVGAASGRLIFVDPLRGSAAKASPTGAGSTAFWSYEVWIRRLQWRVRTLTAATGAIYAVRRNAYAPLPEAKSSDIAEPLWLVRNGWRVAFASGALAYEDTTETARQEFRMRVRVIVGGILGVLSAPELLRPWRWPWASFQLFSHKVARWLAGWALLALLAANLVLIGQLPFRWILAAQLAFYLSALAGVRWPLHRLWRPLGIPAYFCTLNAASVVAGVDILRGRDYATWTPVRRLGSSN